MRILYDYFKNNEVQAESIKELFAYYKTNRDLLFRITLDNCDDDVYAENLLNEFDYCLMYIYGGNLNACYIDPFVSDYLRVSDVKPNPCGSYVIDSFNALPIPLREYIRHIQRLLHKDGLVSYEIPENVKSETFKNVLRRLEPDLENEILRRMINEP